ncbi:single-stranded DNA-binding protein [Psychrilyobacter sp.]|uniref:single-stranded DNA-binding protein n=1 Tax=Psychrilyobacter sp. TaxID=2586924 RepID=UPI00301616A0
MSMNLVVLTGRLVRDPELKYGQSGMAFCRFTLAVNRMKKDDPADFIGCTAFGKTAELIGEYLRKGNNTGVQGRIQTRTYEVNGEKRYGTDVIVDRIEFLESRSSGANSFESESNSKPKTTNSYNQPKHTEPKQSGVVEEEDDEFPF